MPDSVLKFVTSTCAAGLGSWVAHSVSGLSSLLLSVEFEQLKSESDSIDSRTNFIIEGFIDCDFRCNIPLLVQDPKTPLIVLFVFKNMQ